MPVIVKESRILVVDDSIIMRNMVRNILSGFGYVNLEEAGNGRLALEKIREAKTQNNPFRIIFLDWAMPEMTGLELLEACRADPELADLGIVMVTAVADQNNTIEAITKGANAYITKPFSPEKVSEALKYVSVWAEKIGRK